MSTSYRHRSNLSKPQHEAKSGPRRTVRQLPQRKLLDKGRFKNRLAPFSHSSPVVVRLTRMDAVSCRSRSRRTRTLSRSGAASVAAIDSPSRPIRPMGALSPAPTAVPRSDGGATCESASLKKPTGKGRQTCRPARSGCPSWLCGVAETPVHFKEIASTFPSLALKVIIHSTIFSSCRSGG